MSDQHTTPPDQTPAPAVTLHHGFAWNVRSRPVVRLLFTLTTLFLVCSVAGQLLALAHPDSALVGSVMRATDAGLEGNLPSLYNAALLLVCAVLLGLLAAGTRPRGSADARAWRTLTWVFSYLTADEYLHVHEMLTVPVRRLLNVDGLLHYAWVVPYAVLGVALFAVLRPFLRRLPGPVFRRMLVAGALYLLGAMGLEMVGGLLDTLLGDHSLSVLVLSTAEEGLEMTGLTLFIGVLIDHLRAQRPGTSVHLTFTAADSAT